MNSFKRVPFGEPDANESPIRYPNVLKEYSIDIINSLEIDRAILSGALLPIGKFRHDENESFILEDYVIPCMYLNSQPSLVQMHNSLYTMLNSFQTAAYTIMEKTANKPKITELGLNIRQVTERVLEYLATTFFDYRSILPYQSPIYLLRYFSNFAHVFFIAVRLVVPGEREEMLKYFYEWKDVTPSNFEERLANVIEQRYNHLEIKEYFATVIEFINVMVSLWSKLATLEYIGQRRENIVVAEQKVIQEVQTKRTWSLLD
ncbi:hypothetical protein [Sphingobacterium bovistauri]|uniref:Uncharacterized protein n=1 Tax=Sphingobacterium bovistauri TaxID=2781959 RepID=A0ABS7Z7R5_9SPHI|nr:hypothetical protein [Sphingobacterium bovistauri]MCA5006233.1 hypothetical protein [Sphingobacterium bovistauri]